MATSDAVDVRRLRRSAFVGAVGDGVAAVALLLLAAGLTRDPLAIAGVVAAQHLPWVLLALALPRLDRVDRRTLAGAGGSLRALAVAFAGMSAVVGDETILGLQVVAFLLGIAQALDDDAQRVGADVLTPPSNGSNHASFAGAGMLGLGLVGLPLGGALYELLAPIPLLFDVGVFAVAALLALSLRRPLVAAAASGPRDVAALPKPAPGTSLVIAVAAIASAATGAVAGIVVLLALDDLALGAPAFGLFLAGLSAGALVGGLLAPVLGSVAGPRLGTAVALLASALALAAAWSLLDPDAPLPAMVALGVAAGSAMAAGVLVRALLHAAAGERVDGEGLRAFHLLVWAATPAGALLGGLVARSIDPDGVLLAAAATSVIAAVAAGVAPRRKAVPQDVGEKVAQKA